MKMLNTYTGASESHGMQASNIVVPAWYRVTTRAADRLLAPHHQTHPQHVCGPLMYEAALQEDPGDHCSWHLGTTNKKPCQIRQC